MSFIDIKNVIFEYFRRDEDGDVEEMVEALSDVSISVEQGEFVAILGENGSGKSTLAKHINALITPVEGEVIVDGMDTEDEELRLNIRKTAGMVFQNPDNQIVGSVVEEDVAFGPENLGFSTEKIWNQVDGALDATDMNDYRTSSPNRLSGGQKQRVAIAGVLAMEPKCIIFDEATAMLDPKSRKQMLETALKLNREKNITIIWITHHMDEVYAADKVFVMNNGKLAGEGTPKEILTDERLLQESGLIPPQYIQYINFLNGQGIITDDEAAQIENDKQLIKLLCRKQGISDYENGQSNSHDSEYDDISITGNNIDNYGASDYDPSKGILLNDVSYIYNKDYANERTALDNVTLHIDKGEFVAVVGHTGSGKSTLMQHLNGLLLPDKGNIYFDGRDIGDRDYPIKELRQKVGLVFQYPEYQLFAETVEQDVSFGPLNMDISKVEAQKRAYMAIEAVGLPDTIYDASPLWLSGGQKRRVAIAGVLAMEPEYLILDEPTAGLDPMAAKMLMDMLKNLQLSKGITVVIVSHSMEEVAEYADRMVVMDNGRIVMDDVTWKVFRYKNEIEKLGLSVPVGINILNELYKAGLQMDITKHRMQDIFEELTGLAG